MTDHAHRQARYAEWLATQGVRFGFAAEGKDPLDFATDLEDAASDAFDDDFANLGGGW